VAERVGCFEGQEGQNSTTGEEGNGTVSEGGLTAQNQAQQAAQAALLMAGAGLPGMNQVAAAAAMQELMKISLTQQQLQPGMSRNDSTNAQAITAALTQQLEQQIQNEANQKQQANIKSNAIANSKAIQSLRLRAPPPLTHMGKGGGSNSNQSTKPT